VPQIPSRRCFGRGGRGGGGGAALDGARLGYRFVPGGERVGISVGTAPRALKDPHLDARRLPRLLLRSAFTRICFGTPMARTTGKRPRSLLLSRM